MPMKRLVLSIFALLLLISNPRAAPLRFSLLQNADGSFDLQYPAGNKPPASADLAWDTACLDASLGIIALQTTGTATSIDVGPNTCLLGMDAATATITEDGGADWSIATNGDEENLTHAGINTGSGFLRLTADVGDQVLSAIYPWAYQASPTDTIDPPPPTAISYVPVDSSSITVSFDAVSDTCGNAECSGIDHYNIKKGGSTIDTLVPANPGLNYIWTPASIGSPMGSPSWMQTGQQIEITGVGLGTEATADGIYGASTSITGDITIIAKLTAAEDPSPSTYPKCGIDLRSSTVAGSAAMNASFLHAGSPVAGTDYMQSYSRTTLNGNRSTAGQQAMTAPGYPIWMLLRRDSGGEDVAWSSDGGPWNYIVTDKTSINVTSSALVFPYATPTSDGDTNDCDFEYITMSTQGRLSKTVSWTGTDTLTVTAVDADGNESDVAASVSASASTPSISGIKWHPGHYGFFHVSPGQTSGSTWQNARFAAYDTTANNADIVGWKFELAYKDLEPAYGDRSAGIALLQAELAHLKNLAEPKRLVLMVYDVNYFGKNSSHQLALFPQWFIDAGCVVTSTSPQSSSMWKKWDATCRGYWLDTMAAYAAVFDDDPYLEVIQPFYEEPVWVPDSANNGFTYSGRYSGIKALAAGMRTYFENTQVFIQVNNLYTNGGDFVADTRNLYDYLETIGVAPTKGDLCIPTVPVYGADPAGCSYMSDYVFVGTNGGRDFRGVLAAPFSTESSEFGWNSVGPSQGYTSAQAFTYMNGTYHASYIFWDYSGPPNCVTDGQPKPCANANQRWNGTSGHLDTIAANPTLTYTDCPTSYDDIFGDGSAGSGCDTN